ncbi:MAG: hypothetical protein CMM18_00885 [Rhodospirillaceae bacterium]|nr:hypothetical protein [Rhodospirillaceae bacterium]
MKSNTVSIIFFSSLLMAISPFATDTYVPSLPTISKTLDSPASTVQMTLSVYLFAFAIGQLFWGPLADSIGRKKTILVGIIIFLIGTAGCYFSSDIELIIFFRGIQGFGASFGQILARAIIRDLHSPSEGTRITAFSTMAMGSASIIGPNIGAILTSFYSWKFIFIIVFIYGVIILLFTSIKFTETHLEENKTSINPKEIFNNFYILIKDINFCRYTISLTLVFGCIFAFISSGPFVATEVYKIDTAKLGLVFTPLALAFILFSAVTSKLITVRESSNLFLIGLYISVLGGITIFLGTLLYPNIITLLFGAMIIAASMGIVVPIGFTLAISNHPKIAGTASTLLGFIQASFSALFGYITVILYDNSAIPMSIVMLVLTSFSLLAFIFIKNKT